MLPVIALVGRPNVGKSTLSNRLTRTRDALVADQPGLTRDRQYGLGKIGDRPYLVVDTGGITGNKDGVELLMDKQVRTAIDEADHILFLVDGQGGMNADDQAIASQLRRTGKPVTPVVNKSERLDPSLMAAEFHPLGLGDPYPISAAHGQGVNGLAEQVLATLPLVEESELPEHGIRIAVVGRPNVGKSTLVNRMLGEERVVAYDQPGTTRDSIRIPYERDGKPYTLIDTAGVRRRARVEDAIEKFSVIKTLQAIEEAHVVLLVLDAQQGISDQDAGLAGHVLEAGRAVVLVVNKWDGLHPDRRDHIRSELERRLPFLNFAETRIISALHGSGVGDLYPSVERAYESATRKLSTPELNRILEDALQEHQPPLVHGRRVKLRYAHQGGQNPPLIVIHGNQTEALPDSYRRYLTARFRKALHLEGTPIRIELRSGENPFKGRKNTLTPRQVRKKQRLKRLKRDG